MSDYSLRQMDDDYVRSLEAEALRGLSLRLLADIKEARERLNQGPGNSSRPPSSRVPWERGASLDPTDESDEAKLDEAEPGAAEPAKTPPARQPGKQPGTPGIGRTQVFQAHEERAHHPAVCAGCGEALEPAGAVVYTGFQAVDLRWGDPARPGLTLWVVDHRYYEIGCACGHHTRAEAGRGAVNPLLAGIELREWRLVGPGLAALIVALSLRFRRSRARIQEFLDQWLKLSLGTIHQTIHEASAAVAPAEDELVEAVLASGLLHADETSWPERGQLLWLN
ncbi:IS66 family transposase [Candidatus Contendibacter odensensis]|uniref:IS66 family transposase n=1 Tax=Candidatus Contendibacter odensensis TaxID=1400860 RepID=UPI0012B69B55|nr:transposase [Candidatus Contendobacter odensis]